MGSAGYKTDETVCHCLQVTTSEIVTAADVAGASTVREVMKCTGAGKGCTACHRRIRTLLADQCPSGASPICVIK